MKISMYRIAADSFAPMLKNLSEFLDEGAAYAKDRDIDLVNSRLAPDMFTLAQQVQQACHYARNGMARLAGHPAVPMGGVGTTLSRLKQQIAETLDFLRGVTAAEFEGAEARDCGIEIPNGLMIEMDGMRFLTSWSLPHFYFHVVTAYDILRHLGVVVGKKDYLSQVGSFIRAKAA
jgi:uncharacterized protein